MAKQAWLCGFCLTAFRDERSADYCEGNHIKAKALANQWSSKASYELKYPQWLEIEMDDGKIIKYEISN